MNSDRLVLAIAMIGVAFLFLVSFAFAEPTAPDSLSPQQTGRRNASILGAETIGAQGGNVTEVNIQALSITTSWQGYYGDISGEITLDDANNNTFYNWSITSTGGEVYATRASTVNWNNVNCTNSTNKTNEETYLGHGSTDSDSVTNTFNLTTHAAFAAGPSNILANTCYSTYGYVDNASQSENFSMVLLYDHTAHNVIYSTIIDDETRGFDGGTYDFQMLVGENEKSGQAGATNYYFWVELD